MARIMKRFPLELQDEQFVSMHWLGHAHISLHDNVIYLHASVETELPPKKHRIFIVGDQQALPYNAVKHLGSFQLRNSTWHVFK